MSLDYVTGISTIPETCGDNMSASIGVCKVNIAGFSLDSFKTLDPSGYTILCRFGETCEGLMYYPNTAKLVISAGEQSKLMSGFPQIIPNIAKDLAISEKAAIDMTSGFFMDKSVTVQPIGLQGKVYSMIQNLENYVPMIYTGKALTTARTIGLTGAKVITQAPLTFVGASYVGAVFVGYCGCIAGNNTAGLVLNYTSYALSLPMKGLEVVVNGVLLRPVSNLIGFPLILNGTNQIASGVGISVKEYSKIAFGFERLMNSTAIHKVKKVYKIIRGTD